MKKHKKSLKFYLISAIGICTIIIALIVGLNFSATATTKGVLDQNLNSFKNAAFNYYRDGNFPTSVGGTKTTTLDIFINRGYINTLRDEYNNACNSSASYAEIKKINYYEYSLKVQLKCNYESKYITDTIDCYGACKLKNNYQPGENYPSTKYTVKFDSAGGSYVSSQSVTSGNFAYRPIEPSKYGYVFDGWYYNGYTYNFNKAVTGNITLTAHWTRGAGALENTRYKVTFDSKGGSYVAPQTVIRSEYLIRPTEPVKNGYRFDGWYQGNYIYEFNTTVNKSFTLTAKWTYVGTSTGNTRYTVSFDSNGGSYVSNQSVYAYDYATRPSNPIRNGYRFDGWYYNGSYYNFNTSVTRNMTLTAKWTYVGTSTGNTRYTVSFDSNGGSYVSNQSVYAYDYASRPSDPIRNGYRFDGWYYNGSYYNFNTSVTRSITLIAKWTYVGTSTGNTRYIVSFDSNGGSYVSNQSVYAYDYVTRPSNPTRSGYNFNGWYYNGSLYNFNTSVTRSITLTAKWTKKNTSTSIYTANVYTSGYTTSNTFYANRSNGYYKGSREVVLGNIPSYASNVKINSTNYFGSSDYQSYINANGTSQMITSASQFRNSSLNSTNFTFDVGTPYYSGGSWRVKVTTYIYNLNGVSPTWASNVGDNVYLVPTYFHVNYSK